MDNTPSSPPPGTTRFVVEVTVDEHGIRCRITRPDGGVLALPGLDQLPSTLLAWASPKKVEVQEPCQPRL